MINEKQMRYTLHRETRILCTNLIYTHDVLYLLCIRTVNVMKTYTHFHARELFVWRTLNVYTIIISSAIFITIFGGQFFEDQQQNRWRENYSVLLSFHCRACSRRPVYMRSRISRIRPIVEQ